MTVLVVLVVAMVVIWHTWAMEEVGWVGLGVWGGRIRSLDCGFCLLGVMEGYSHGRLE